MTPVTGGFQRWLFLAGGALAATVAGGCPAENRRVFTQPARAAPALVGTEAPDEVRRAWGDPDRTFALVDAKSGKSQTVWQYDRFVDANGSKLTTTVTFADGRIVGVERLPVPRTPAAAGLERDSAARRDME